MATDYAEMEREFLAGLEADTGRDLAQWMTLIDAQRLAHRNDIIDWLRQQGFAFSWASWLERIHHNGGRPIYAPKMGKMGTVPFSSQGEADHPPTGQPFPRATPPSPPPPPQPAHPPAGKVGTVPAPPRPAVENPPIDRKMEPSPFSHELAALLATAKAYRPLAEHLIREVRRLLTGVHVDLRGGYISFSRPAELAALAVGPRELRLGLDLGPDADEKALPRGRMVGTAAQISHVLVLTDARQVTPALLEAVLRADARVNRG